MKFFPVFHFIFGVNIHFYHQFLILVNMFIVRSQDRCHSITCLKYCQRWLCNTNFNRSAIPIHRWLESSSVHHMSWRRHQLKPYAWHQIPPRLQRPSKYSDFVIRHRRQCCQRGHGSGVGAASWVVSGRWYTCVSLNYMTDSRSTCLELAIKSIWIQSRSVFFQDHHRFESEKSLCSAVSWFVNSVKC